MENFLFFLFSILTLGAGLMVVLSRNTVNSAMFMIVSFVGTAGIFFLLEAFFIGILQILVYAGAVMVLFLFVIMLLNVDKMAVRRLDWRSLVYSLVGLGVLSIGVFYGLEYSPELFTGVAPVVKEKVDFASPFAYTTSSQSFGYGLFTKYMLPLQVAGFLLLMAMVGIVVISKRHR